MEAPQYLVDKFKKLLKTERLLDASNFLIQTNWFETNYFNDLYDILIDNNIHLEYAEEFKRDYEEIEKYGTLHGKTFI
jgi:hypothetical protein